MKVKKQIKLEQAEVGQMLADDVCDAGGNCLMATGVVLSSARLKHLRERSIDRLMVWEEHTLSETEIAEQQLAIKARLAHRFRQTQDQPGMSRLHDILLAWRMARFDERVQDEVARVYVDDGGDEEGV